MNNSNNKQIKVIKTDQEWQSQLTAIQYQITRCHGTERAFSSPDFDTSTPGIFRCICCGNKLYHSDSKYESGTGWPSFTHPLDKNAVTLVEDRSYGMVRTEVRCTDCDAHLGHVFPDGPAPKGLRFCMNGHALSYDKDI